eukprot:scaffold63018_cov50-Phaeocystis_antarctica.AAC.1
MALRASAVRARWARIRSLVAVYSPRSPVEQVLLLPEQLLQDCAVRSLIVQLPRRRTSSSGAVEQPSHCRLVRRLLALPLDGLLRCLSCAAPHVIVKRMTPRGRRTQVEKMNVRTDNQESQMKAELKPLEDTDTKSRTYTKVVLAGIFCLSLCVNVALSALLASKETCVTGVALLEEGQEVWDRVRVRVRVR